MGVNPLVRKCSILVVFRARIPFQVDHLEDHGAYIDGSDLAGGSDPALAVDLLLGTQGWRRFLYRDPLEKLTGEGTSETGEKVRSGTFEERRLPESIPFGIELGKVESRRRIVCQRRLRSKLRIWGLVPAANLNLAEAPLLNLLNTSPERSPFQPPAIKDRQALVVSKFSLSLPTHL